MAIIELYTSPLCGYCHAAKRLLDAKGATFQEVDLSQSPERRSEMQTRANGRHTVPQIFIDDLHIGGCDELYALDRSGKLADVGAVKVAIAQITSSDQPAENLATVSRLMDQSAGQDILFLPEVTNCISVDRAHQFQVLEPYAGNSFIEAICARARHLGLWVALGSVTVKTDDDDGRFANRSVMINAEGEIVAFYDKIHMFDVTLSDTERYHESKGYRPGTKAAVVQTPWAELGLVFAMIYGLRHCIAPLRRRGPKFWPCHLPLPAQRGRRIGMFCCARARLRRGAL